MCAKSKQGMTEHEKEKQPIAVCSFIGHEEVYDADLEHRLQTVVEQIIEYHETVEFLIYPRGRFYYLCMLAALRARTCFPQKVTITLVLLEDNAKYTKVPIFIPNKVVTLQFSPTKKYDVTIPRKKLLKWSVQKSTHLISYNYGKLYDAESHIPKRQAALNIISLTSPETEEAILETAPLMTEKEQIVFQSMNEGCSLIEAGTALEVSRERARQLLQHGCRTIRKHLSLRYNKAMATEQKQREHTCGLFILGEATYGSLSRFKGIFDFLTSAYGIKCIHVEQSYIHSSFMFVLTTSYHNTLHITGMISGKSLAESNGDLDHMLERFCPPCHAVGCVSHAGLENNADSLDVIINMLEQTDFCICDLSATPHAEKIQKYASQVKRTVLLDLSRTDAEVDKYRE